MDHQPSLSDQILRVIMQCGGGTIDRLTQEVVNARVIPEEQFQRAGYRYAKSLTTQVMKQKNAEGVQVFIITPRREGKAHVWVQLELAGLEDCKYKMARDIHAVEHDIASLQPFHTYIFRTFGIDLPLPTLELLPNQDRWWVETLDKYDVPEDGSEYKDPDDDDC